MNTATSWATSQGRIIDRIVVTRSDYESEDPWTVIDSLSDFAARAGRDGGLSEHEIPAEVLWNSQVTAFCLHVDRNGVAGYVNNVIVNGLDDEARLEKNREAAQRGLTAIGASGHLEMLIRIHATWHQLADQFREAHRNRRLLKHPTVDALFDDWLRLDSDALVAARVRWIRDLPNLLVVDDVFHAETIARLWTKNPMRTERLDERRIAEAAELEAIRAIEARQAAKWAEIEARARRDQGKGRRLWSFIKSIGDQ